MLKRLIPIVYCFALHISHVAAQNIITDTVFVDFKTDSFIPPRYVIDTIPDKRAEHSRVISYSQRKKFFLIPVDQEICLKKPLAYYIKDSSSVENAENVPHYQVHIDYFLIDQYKGRIFKQYLLLADMPLYQYENGSYTFKGTLSYSYEYQPKTRKPKKAEVVSELLPVWHRQFKIDLLTTGSYLNNKQYQPENFLEQEFKRPYYMATTFGSAIGINFWQVEAELSLTRPETYGSYWNISRIVRYQKTDDFELFAYGKKSEHFNKRINDHWKFDINFNLLLGFVKWKETEETKLYQLFQLSGSSVQCVAFDPKNKPGFIFKAGLFENCYYIVKKPVGLQIGLYVSTGYKF